jgi:hypothetical protein
MVVGGIARWGKVTLERKIDERSNAQHSKLSHGGAARSVYFFPIRKRKPLLMEMSIEGNVATMTSRAARAGWLVTSPEAKL